MNISYNRMVDSPVGSLLGCYVFKKEITKEKAMEMFKKASSRNDLPTPDTVDEAYHEWIKYFKLDDFEDIFAFRNEYTFRFAVGIHNDEGQYGFFPLQDDGVYTFFERMFVNTNNCVPLTHEKRDDKKSSKKKHKETKETSDSIDDMLIDDEMAKKLFTKEVK